MSADPASRYWESCGDVLLQLQQAQLDAIGAGDYPAYQQLCHPALTCFEPEAKGHLVEGMAFHRTYFENQGAGSKVLRNTMCRPKVRGWWCWWCARVGARVVYAHPAHPRAAAGKAVHTLTHSRPQVQLMGDPRDPRVAVITYVRLVQVLDAQGCHSTVATQVRTGAVYAATPLRGAAAGGSNIHPRCLCPPLHHAGDARMGAHGAAQRRQHRRHLAQHTP